MEKNSISNSNASDRIDGLDFCRAIFMILGLFYHVGLIYGGEQNWRVYSEEGYWGIKVISDFIHQFRMEAFYLISGFFYTLIFSKDRPGFLKNRTLRLLIPLVFCGALINSVMNYYSYNFTYSVDLDYLIGGEWVGHLWFLGNLFVYFIVSFPLMKLIIKANKLNPSALLLFFYVVFPLFAVLGLIISNLTYEGIILFISFDQIFYFYSYFFLGCLCFSNKESFISILDSKYLPFSLAIFSVLSFVVYFNFIGIDAVNLVISNVAKGSLVLFMTAALYILGSRKSKSVRSVSESSYTIYLLHEPLIVLSYVFVFSGLKINPIIEYFLIISAVFFLSYSFHNLLVKKSQVLRCLLNGVLPDNAVKK